MNPTASNQQTSIQSDTGLEQQLVEVIRFLHRQGWTPATSSNFSYRHPVHSDSFFISLSGKDKGALEPGEFIPVDIQGQGVGQSQGKPSAETLLHALVYRKLPETGFVLHTHSVNGTVLSKLYEASGSLLLRDFEILKGLEGIQTHQTELSLPVFPNDQDMSRLAERIEKAWDAGDRAPYGFLLAGHGLYAWGRTPAEARRHVEVFEFLFECILQLRSHGYPDYS